MYNAIVILNEEICIVYMCYLTFGGHFYFTCKLKVQLPNILNVEGSMKFTMQPLLSINMYHV